jgi:hypothetical protein
MLRLAWIALLVCCAFGFPLFSPGTVCAQEQPAEQKPPADKPATDASAASSATSANKPKRVITNDDIRSSPFSTFGGLFYTNSGSINDCDAGCFDQVHLMGHLGLDKNPNWRTDVLRQVDQVRSDGEWQAYLHELYNAHNRICQLTFDKEDELRRSGNRRNLGPQEIAITERYDEKAKAAEADLSELVAQQPVLQKKFFSKPYANAFASVQGFRMRSGFCSQARVIYLQ